MEILRRKDQRFSVSIGKKKPDPVLPAMPIEIIYVGVERDYSKEVQNGEYFFRMRAPKEFTPGWALSSVWDPYGLRASFEALRSPDDAWMLLNVIGTFRQKRAHGKGASLLTWRELVNWQKLLRRLRTLDSSHWFPTLGVQKPELKESFLQSEFLSEESREFVEQIWDVSEDTFGWLQGFPQGLYIRRDRYLTREEITAIFSTPGAQVRGSREWHQAQSILARRRAARARGNQEGKQKLIAEITPATALDAILATVYVDKLRGVELQVCALKECNETFEKQSDHGKMYCSNYHAHLASVRRKRANAKGQKGRGIHRKEKTK